MWTKLNETMLKQMFPKPNFKGFMIDNTQANWNIIKIIYGYGDPFVRMVNKECTCLFHWIQSFDRHTKNLIKPKLQDQHNILCHQYKNAKSLWRLTISMLQFIVGGYHQGLLRRQVFMSLQIGLTFGIFMSTNGEVSWSM
jgi:hypothetical protein